jgi:hypothetical protein
MPYAIESLIGVHEPGAETIHLCLKIAIGIAYIILNSSQREKYPPRPLLPW